jgi:hypothetical protein
MSATRDLNIDAAPEKSGARRGLLLVLLLVVLAGAAALAMTFLGGSDTADEPLATAATPTTTDASDTVGSSDSDVVAMPAMTYEVFLSRDPFEPVVPETETATPVTDASGDDAGGSSEDLDNGATGNTGGTDTTGDDDVAAGSDGCRGTSEVVCDGRVVSLVDITEREGELVAVVQIDTTIYEVRKGEAFAQRFVLMDVTNTTATISYVEDAFTLMVGDRVLK